MAEELVYDACLEVRSDGACLAQLSDLPACFARAEHEAQALTSLEASLPAYFAWLARHDEYTPVMHGPFRVVAAETLRTSDPAVGAFFQADAPALSADDLDWYAALLDWSYQDYEVSLATANDSALTAANRLCEAQAWLLTRLELAPSSPESPDLPALQRVAQIHSGALQRVRAASGEDRSRIHELDGERWSLRKTLRRSILLVREAAQALG